MFDRNSFIALLKPDRDWSQCSKDTLADECATRFVRRQADYPPDFGSAALRRRLPALLVDGECGFGSLCDLYAADRFGDPVVMDRYLFAETNYMTYTPKDAIERILDSTNGLLLYKEDCQKLQAAIEEGKLSDEEVERANRMIAAVKTKGCTKLEALLAVTEAMKAIAPL